MSTKWIPLVEFGLVLCIAGGALADGVMLNGTSPRSIGRGGTNIAFADNGAVLFDNPAGAVNVEGQTLFDLGFDLMLGDYHYTNPLNDSGSDNSVYPLPQVSVIRKSPDGCWAYGLGMFTPAGFGEAFDLQLTAPFAGSLHHKSLGTLTKFLPGVACRATDRLSLGATLGVAVSHDELEGAYTLQGPSIFRGTPTLIDLQATGAALCWSFGMQYELSELTTLGVTYQSQSRFRAEGNTRVTLPDPQIGQIAFDSQLDITWPRSLGIGVRHELCPHRIASVDVIWFNWSEAFDDLGVHLTDASIPLFPDVYEQLPLGWRDTVSVRAGYEQALSCGRVFRCGYVYHRNPIPEGTLTPYIQATFEHAFSVGYGWQWRCWDVDLAYMFAFGPDLTVGANDLVGDEFDNSFHKAQMHAICFSLMRQW